MPFEYQLKLSARRKTIAIRVSRGEVTVYAPQRVCKTALQQWLETKQAWVNEKVAQTSTEQPKREDSSTRLIFGEPYAIQIENMTCHYQLDHENKVIRLNSRHEHDREIILEQIRATLLSEYLDERLSYWQNVMKVTIASVKVRFYKSRWGSCDSKGRLTFNTRLTCLEKELIDYVIVHEFAHRKHLNHSNAFWSLVALYYPQYQQARKAIKAKAKAF